jgi:myo-inositol 2-dehydrogenase/D-chiro-inositol 1-dehydrogenase
MAPVRLKVACAGLGRMGKRHALHFAERVPRAELVAVSSPDEEELKWARERLGPFGVAVYKNYDDMLKHEGLQAVVVASATAVHAEQAIKAIEADLHVLCEKPLSTSVEIVRFIFFFLSTVCERVCFMLTGFPFSHKRCLMRPTRNRN